MKAELRRSILLAPAACVLLMVTAPFPQAQTPSAKPTAPPGTNTYVVHLQGGDVGRSAANVLQVLAQSNALPLAQAKLEKGQDLCEIFVDRTNFPGQCNEGLAGVAAAVNPAASPSKIPTGATVSYPGIVFERYQYEKQYDLRYATDRAALANDKKVSGAFMHKTAGRNEQFTEHTFDGYRLTFELPAVPSSKALIDRLEGYAGVYVSPVPSAQSPRTTTPNSVAPTTAAQLEPTWCNGNIPPEQPHARLLGVESVTAGDCAIGPCAEIVLIDRPVEPHPELEQALDGFKRPAPPSPQQPPPKRCANPDQLTINRFHGTHLAGIIASQQNDIAFIGIHPGARLFSKDWDVLGEAGVATEVHSRRNRNGLQVYVFANEWKLGPALANGDRLKRPEHRFRHLVAAKIDERVGDLWIVAAGQATSEPEDGPAKIDENINRGPMNLGDRRNVIVVTGCERCATAPLLWPLGNFSPEFVHVAAPSDVVISTATDSSYTWAQGTSQATAFVAGVASALVSKWPDRYRNAERVKERLQYTATPFQSSADRSRIAAGVVNPTLALLDPEKDYVDTTNQNAIMAETALAGWCAARLTVTSGGNDVEHGEVDTAQIYRMVGVTTDRGREWVIFAERRWNPQPGVVLQIEAGVPVVEPYIGRAQSRPLLKKKDGTILTPEQIEDLLVRPGTLPTVSCS